MKKIEVDITELSKVPENILNKMINEINQDIDYMRMFVDILSNECEKAKKEREFLHYLRYGYFPE